MDPPTQSSSDQQTVFIFMGVAGCGKSTAAIDFQALLSSSSSTSTAASPRPLPPPTPFLEADDFHSPENKAKMAAGTPLTDADRWPWLAALGGAIARSLDAIPPARVVVATCSALKQAYRHFLATSICKSRAAARVVYVWLDVAEHELEARLRARSGHYMGASMLASQLATLEAPTLDNDADGALLAYRVVRVDCASSDHGQLSREQALERVLEAVLCVCPDFKDVSCAKR